MGVLTLHLPSSKFFREDDPVLRIDTLEKKVKVQLVMLDPQIVNDHEYYLKPTLNDALMKISDIPAFVTVELGGIMCKNPGKVQEGNLGAEFCTDPVRRAKYTARGFRFE